MFKNKKEKKRIPRKSDEGIDRSLRQSGGTAKRPLNGAWPEYDRKNADRPRSLDYGRENSSPRMASGLDRDSLTSRARSDYSREEAIREKKSRDGRQKNAKRRAAKRKNARLLTCILIALIVITVAVCLSFTVLFRVGSITTEGESIYSPEQIVSASGISENINMFSINTDDVERRICEKLPYIGEAKIKRVFPSSVVIEVTPETEAFVFNCETGFAAVSSDFKALELTDQAGERTVVGAQLGEISAGEKLGLSDELKQSLTKLEETLETVGMTDVSVIDITDQNDIKLLYKSKYVLRLGDTELLEYKLKFCLKVTEAEQNQGVVDVRYITESNKKGFYTPKNISGEITLP